MKCPECEHEFKQGYESKDFQGNVGRDTAEALLVCPSCKQEYFIGTITQAEMED